MKKSYKNWMGTRFIAGPADGAVIISVGPPPHGYMVYWKYGVELEYRYFQGEKLRISLYKEDIEASKRVRGRYVFRGEGLTHIYVYSIDVDQFIYAGLFPIVNPLNLKSTKK